LAAVPNPDTVDRSNIKSISNEHGAGFKAIEGHKLRVHADLLSLSLPLQLLKRQLNS
jgi:hypothetical protein